MSAQGEIPTAQVAALHYPGLVKSVPKALETLGGMEAVESSLQKEGSELHLRYRPSDPLCHPLVGTCTSAGKTSQQGFVVRLSYPKRRKAESHNERLLDSNQEAQVSIAATARISTLVTFNGMCDFQFTSADGKGVQTMQQPHSAALAGDAPFAEVDQDLLTVPPLFSRDDLPNDYAFRKAKGHNMPTKSILPARKAPITVGWRFQKQIPKTLHVLGYRETELDLKLQYVLKKRPVWSPALLAKQFKNFSKEALEVAVHRACYCFKLGPWSGLLIARGLDPRLDPDFRRWQRIPVVLPKGWHEFPAGKSMLAEARKRRNEHESEQAKKPPENMTFQDVSNVGTANLILPSDVQELIPWIPKPDIIDVLNLQVLPSPEIDLLQVGDIGDAAIQAIVETPSQISKCHTTHGWFTETALDQISDRLQINFEMQLRGEQPLLREVVKLVECPDLLCKRSNGENDTPPGPKGHFDDPCVRKQDKSPSTALELLSSAPASRTEEVQEEDFEDFHIYDEGDDDDDNENALNFPIGRDVALGIVPNDAREQDLSFPGADSGEEEEEDFHIF